MVYSLITLYSSNETEFETNGLGSLNEAASCTVVEEANGGFELELTYPITGRRYKDLVNRAIILAKPNPIDPPQPFRIYEISRPMNGLVTFYAAHISYDLSGYPVKPFKAGSATAAMSGLKTNSVAKHPFTFWTDKNVTSEFVIDTPIPTRTALGGIRGSILDTYAGEYKFDGFVVKLYQHRGADRGVVVRYGKNLTDLNQEENCSNVYTGVLPYWRDEEEGILVELPETYVPTEGTYDFVNIYTLDLSDAFEEQPTVEQLRERTQKYIKDNKLGTPKVSLKISFAQLEQTEEYKHLSLLERVELFDTIKVEFPEMNVSSKAKVCQTKYDVLTGRYRSVTVGEVRASISNTIVEQGEAADQIVNEAKSELRREVERATNWIVNGRGYMVAVKDEAGNWIEICSLDTPNLDTAVNVWRWNNGGFGHSSHGYNGPYDTAITQDGRIVADFITTGTLTATLIRSGILQSLDGETFFLDLEAGILRMKANELTIEGKTIYDISNQAAIQNLDQFINYVYGPDMEELKDQIDGKIDTWFEDYEPTLNNKPASNWKTEEERSEHEGDLFFWKSKGYAYRFFKNGNTWVWQLVQDTDVTKALAQAAKAQATADGKARVFYRTPTPPYDLYDLWAQGTGGDIMICINARQDGAYVASDWAKSNDYIDKALAYTIANDSLSNFLTNEYYPTIQKIQNQTDQKSENWYQATDPVEEWIYIQDSDGNTITDSNGGKLEVSNSATIKKEHEGDLWYNTKDQKIYYYDGTKWKLSTTDVPDELFDKIDGKSSTYISQPKPPYYVGDTWFQSATSDIMTCINTRLTGNYTASDWQKRNKYIDQAKAKEEANAAVDAQTQKSIFDKLTNGGKNQGIYMNDGLLYINATYMKAGIISDNQGLNNWNLLTGEFTAKKITAYGSFRCGGASSSNYTMLNTSNQLGGYRDNKRIAYIDYSAAVLFAPTGETKYGMQLQANEIIRISTPMLTISDSGDTSVTAYAGDTHTIKLPARISQNDDGTLFVLWQTFTFINGILVGVV